MKVSSLPLSSVLRGKRGLSEQHERIGNWRAQLIH